MSMKSETEQLDRQIAEAIQGVAKAVGQAVVDGRKTCVHCIYFNQNSETCALAGQRPPGKGDRLWLRPLGAGHPFLNGR